MGLLEQINKGLKTAGEHLSWAWGYVPTNYAYSAVAYTVNTGFNILDQIATVRKAIPTLVTKKNSIQVANSMMYLVVWDVAPIAALNFVNNNVQQYCQNARDPNSDWEGAYTVFLYGMTLVNFGVYAFIVRQSIQTFSRITVLDSVAPAIFHNDSKREPYEICTKENCTFLRKVKGSFREPFILLTNDALVSVIEKSPFYGQELAFTMRVFFNGRYITRIATPDLCERHKFQLMRSDSVLALGLVFAGTEYLMKSALEASVGIPPIMFYRTLKHILLLMHGNVAAHMKLPVADVKDTMVRLDPLNVYEWICRFSADVLLSGLMQRVPEDFQPAEGTQPLTLSQALKEGADFLNRELHPVEEQKDASNQRMSELLPWVLPAMYHSTDNFIRDPINAAFWPILHKSVYNTIAIVKKYGLSRSTKTANYLPKREVAGLLNYIFGFPLPVAMLLLTLSPDKDFWRFVNALENWLNRHQVLGDVVLAQPSATTVVLAGDRALTTVPEDTESVPTLPVEELVKVEKQDSISLTSLVAGDGRRKDMVSVNPHALFSTTNRRRQQQTIQPVSDSVNQLN